MYPLSAVVPQVRRALGALIDQADPRVLLVGGEITDGELAPRLAHQLKASIVTEAVTLAVEDKRVLVTRPVYGGKALSIWATRTERQVTVLRPKTQPPATLDASRTGEVIPAPFYAPKSTVVANWRRRSAPPSQG